MGYALCRLPPIIGHCFKIEDFWHCCKRILASLVHRPVIWHAWTILGHWGAQQRTFLLSRSVIWHAWWLNFGVLGDLGTILGHNKGHFEVRALIFLDSGGLGTPFLRAFQVLKRKRYLSPAANSLSARICHRRLGT